METLKAKDIYGGKGFASYTLRDELKEKGIADDDLVVNFAFTDYGGDFFDKVCCEYFKKNYKDNFISEKTAYFGKNGILFGDIAKRFIEETEDYLLGFEDIEDFYMEMESKEFDSFVEYVLTDSLRGYSFNKEDVENWLHENKEGYYSITTQGIDFCESDLLDEMEKADLIEKED